jgi:hypothetical protein
MLAGSTPPNTMSVGIASTWPAVDVLRLMIFDLLTSYSERFPVPVTPVVPNVSVEGFVATGTRYVLTSVELLVVLPVHTATVCPDVADSWRPNCCVDASGLVVPSAVWDVGSLGVAVPTVPSEPLALPEAARNNVAALAASSVEASSRITVERLMRVMR